MRATLVVLILSLIAYSQCCILAGCPSGETCVETRENALGLCVDQALYNTVCTTQCFSNPGTECLAVSGATGNTVICECQHGGTPGNCTGEQCGPTYCDVSNEYCGEDLYTSEPICVDYANVDCSNCPFNTFCADFSGSPNYAECACTHGGIYPNCFGPPCGWNTCAFDEACVSSLPDEDPVCINEVYRSEFCANCTRGSNCIGYSDGSLECRCVHGGDYPDCTGQVCGNQICSIDEICYPNVVPTSSPVCVPFSNVFCEDCFGDITQICAGTFGNQGNFASCVCRRPDSTNPNVCLDVMCGDVFCGEWDRYCDNSTGTPQCLCVNGLHFGPLTRLCEPNPIYRACTPCTAGSTSNCGCPISQICELQDSSLTQGTCVCAPGYALNPLSLQCTLIPPTRYPGEASRCFITGDPHIQTFDGRFYDYQERCGHLLARSLSGDLEVVAINGECDDWNPIPSISCVIGARINVDGINIALDLVSFQLEVTVDGTTVTSFPYTLPNNQTIRSENGLTTISLPSGSYIEWTFQTLAISLYPTSEYWNNMEGLCGNFDGIPNNDLLVNGVSVGNSINDFGRYWRTEQCNETLSEILNPFNICYEDPNFQEIISVCESEVQNLIGCEQVMDLGRLYVACIFDACTKGAGGHITMNAGLDFCLFAIDPTFCPFLCVEGEMCVIDNNGNGGCVPAPPCDPECGVGQICSLTTTLSAQPLAICTCDTASGYRRDPNNSTNCILESDCGGITCNNTNEECLPFDTDTGVDFVCACVGDTVRNIATGLCEPTTSPSIFSPCTLCNGVGQTECGCRNENQTCRPNFPGSILGACVCAPGFNYDDSTELCVPGITLPVDAPGMCSIFGDPHYSTFDNVYYENQDKCDIILLQRNNFVVQGRHSECFPQWGTSPVSCFKALAFRTLDNAHTIEINDEEASLDPATDVMPVLLFDGVNTSLPFTYGGITISRVGFAGFRVSFPDGLVILFNRFFSLRIVAPGSYRNNVTGTCGNFDGIAEDDTDGNNFIVPDNQRLFSTPNSYCNQLKRNAVSIGSLSSNPVLNNLKCQREAPTYCGSILSLSITNSSSDDVSCSSFLNLQDYYIACVRDFCSLGARAVDLTIQAAVYSCETRVEIYEEFVNGGSTTGSEDTGSSTTGSQTSTTGSQASTTGGQETSTTGSQASTTGSQASTTGSQGSTTSDEVSSSSSVILNTLVVFMITISVSLLV